MGFHSGERAAHPFNQGKPFFRKVKSTQYAADGKAYEYTLDLGAIPKSVKETAKQYDWKFKTVLNKNKASYPPGYVPSNIQPKTQERVKEPETAGFCSNCGMPLEAGANFCGKCGLPVGAAKQPVAAFAEQKPQAPYQPPQQPPPQYSDPEGKFFAQGKPPGATDKGGKPSTLRAIAFRSIWTVLTLLCIIMIIDEFSVLRFIGFATILGFPIILRKKLFNRFLSSLLSWLAAFIVFFIIMASNGVAG